MRRSARVRSRSPVCSPVILSAAFLASGWVACSAKVKQDVYEQDMAELQGEFDGLDSRISENSGRITANETSIAELRQDLRALEEEFQTRITEIENGLHFAMPVHFEFDRAEIRPADQPALDGFASVVTKHYPGSMVTVEGFADPAGSVEYNDWLSEQRAQNVAAYLTEQGGLDPANVRTAAYGERRLVIPGAEGPGRQGLENRRVTFVIEFGGEMQPLESTVAGTSGASS
ncbi:MAG: OmpA family protein [Gemmatimonadota bacterium]